MDGVMRCTRYAFGPNRLHYCGPDANREILSYLENGFVDAGLETLLKQFRTLFPYLQLIAQANDIRDPFDDRVVEAYWLGNELLAGVGKKRLHDQLRDGFELRKKLKVAELETLDRHVAAGAVPHHNFHVLDVWQRSDRNGVANSLAALDGCRITPAKVLEVDGPSITVEYEPLIEAGGRLTLGSPTRKKIRRLLESLPDIEQLVPGQMLAVHWDVPCEVISNEAAASLKKITQKMLRITNDRDGNIILS